MTIVRILMKTTKRFVLAMILAIGGNVAAFETSTHAAMTAAAAGKSRLGVSPTHSALIGTLGLRDYNFGFGDKYIDIAPQLVTRLGSGFEGKIIKNLFDVTDSVQTPDAYTITGWLMRGAIREDDNPAEVKPRIYQDEPGGTFARVFGHFYDPQNNRALTLGIRTLGPKASDWALVNDVEVPYTPVLNSIAGVNRYNVRSAREAMWRALTLKTVEMNGSLTDNVTPSDWSPPSKEDLRKAYWATTFRALGMSCMCCRIWLNRNTLETTRILDWAAF